MSGKSIDELQEEAVKGLEGIVSPVHLRCIIGIAETSTSKAYLVEQILSLPELTADQDRALEAVLRAFDPTK